MNACNARLAELYDRYPTTELLGGENAKCVIVVPLPDAYRQMAKALNAALPAPLPVLDDDLVATGAPRPWHVVALGNLTNNRVLGDLYLLERACCDKKFPGGDGYVLRTVHNPFLNGRNVVELGGSNENGVGRAVDRLVQTINAGATVLEPTLEVSLPVGSSEDESSDNLRAWEEMAAKGDMSSLAAAISGCASSLFRTGCVEAGEILRGAIHPFFARVRKRWEEVDAGAGTPENMSWHIIPGSELLSADRVPMSWQSVEDLPVFTDEDRLAMAEAILLLAEISTFGLADFPPTPGYHGNMRPAVTSFLLGLYVARHYPDLEVGRRILERADRYYGANLRYWKPVEDATSYAMTTSRENLLYVRHRPAWHWLDTGARQWADNSMRVSDNRGIIPGVGDSGETAPNDLILPLCAWRHRDGNLAWACERGCADRPQFHTDIEPVPPDDMVGVNVLPLDRWIYERPCSGSKSEDITVFDVTLALPECYGEAKKGVPYDQTFDKIVLRAGLEPEDAFLLLSGFNYGHHSHIDANAICAFLDRGKVWFFDNGYMVTPLQEHCTLAIMRDGLWRTPPEVSRLVALADLPSAGHVASQMSDYNGLDWTRHIVWAKGRAFIVIDALEAVEPGAYCVQAVWRSQGAVCLDGDTMTATQGDALLRLVHPSGAQMTVRDCAYPFREIECGAIYETIHTELDSDGQDFVENVFWTERADTTVEREVRKLEPGVVMIRDRQGLLLAGVDALSLSGISLSASSFLISDECLTATQVSYLTVGETSLEFNGDMSLEWTWREETALLRADSYVALTVEEEDPAGGGVLLDGLRISEFAELAQGDHRLVVRLQPGDVEAVRSALRSAWASCGEEARVPTAGVAEASGITTIAKLDLDSRIEGLCCGDIDGDGEDEIALTTFGGSVHVLGADGSVLLSPTFDDGCNDVAMADVDGDGRAEVLVGTRGGDVICLSADGTELWRHSETADGWIPYGLKCPEIVRLYPLDLDGDGQTEILVAIGGMKLLALNGAGDILWRGAYKGRFTTDAFAVQLPGDDERSLLIGNCYFSAARHDQQGKVIEAVTMTWHAGPNRLRLATTPDDGRTVLALGDLMGRIQFTPWLPEECRFDAASGSGPQYETGGTVTVLEWMEPADGEPFWLAGSRSEHVYCFRPDGTLVWWQYLGDIPARAWLAADEYPQIALLTERGEVVRLSLGGQELSREALGARVERSAFLQCRDGETRPVAACERGKVVCVD